MVGGDVFIAYGSIVVLVTIDATCHLCYSHNLKYEEKGVRGHFVHGDVQLYLFFQVLLMGASGSGKTSMRSMILCVDNALLAHPL